jgi:hypothetical protein
VRCLSRRRDYLNTPRLVADAAGTTVWKWDQQEPFGNNVADENPSGLGAFDLPLRPPGGGGNRTAPAHSLHGVTGWSSIVTPSRTGYVFLARLAELLRSGGQPRRRRIFAARAVRASTIYFIHLNTPHLVRTRRVEIRRP